MHPTCMTCLVQQLEKAFRILRPNTPPATLVDIQKRIFKQLADVPNKRGVYYGQRLYQEIAREMKERDPYHSIKQKYNEKALQLVTQLKNILQKSEDPLGTAILVAILGNTIDFGTMVEINIEQDFQNIAHQQLAINDTKSLIHDLEHACRVLVIGDNTGEIVFDKVMLEQMFKIYPKIEFKYAVRGGSTINDATMDDAKAVGLTGLVEVVESSASPGVLLEQASPQFQKAFSSADCIISKGQGNFESLEDIPLQNPGASMYFLFKAKCKLVADIIHVPIGSLILYKRKSTHDFTFN